MPSTTLATAVLRWYRTARRDLPWRAPGIGGWPILVSEVMLQQTQVSRVLPIWRDWMERWPRPSALAAAPPADVLRAWGRLGYPRRALRLAECAGVIADEFDDVVPSDVDTLLTLPGIGDYTARAVAAFAYGQRVPAVDTNVRRVVARVLDGEPRPGAPSARRDLPAVEALLPRSAERAATFSAALMELGALVCTARKPDCARCPLADRCAWLAAGRPDPDGPAPSQRYEGTDRHARGTVMAVLREATGPVDLAALQRHWTRDPGQLQRAVDSLLTDALVEPVDGGFALPRSR